MSEQKNQELTSVDKALLNDADENPESVPAFLSAAVLVNGSNNLFVATHCRDALFMLHELPVYRMGDERAMVLNEMAMSIVRSILPSAGQCRIDNDTLMRAHVETISVGNKLITEATAMLTALYRRLEPPPFLELMKPELAALVKCDKLVPYREAVPISMLRIGRLCIFEPEDIPLETPAAARQKLLDAIPQNPLWQSVFREPINSMRKGLVSGNTDLRHGVGKFVMGDGGIKCVLLSLVMDGDVHWFQAFVGDVEVQSEIDAIVAPEPEPKPEPKRSPRRRYRNTSPHGFHDWVAGEVDRTGASAV